MKKKNNIPHLTEGGIHIDQRGQINFLNSYEFKKVKRFYIVSPHAVNNIRAWHGHKREEKHVLVLQGTILIGAVEIDNWKNPAKDSKPHTFVLSSLKTSILHIPSGFANGFMSLTPDTKVMFFSTSTLQESLSDDFRFDPFYWDIWTASKNA